MPADGQRPSLLVVTPVKDEIQTLGIMTNSVLEQSVGFLEWVILDDGSTDGSREWLEDLIASTPSVRLLRMTGGHARRLGGHVTNLVQSGLEYARSHDWTHWAKVDADVWLAPDYFECILMEMARDQRLGIASGAAMLPAGSGGWRSEWTPEHFPLGMARVYRRGCWKDIGGYVASRHFDIIDVYAARLRGWRTASLAQTTVRLLRRVEGAMPGQLARRFEAGEDLYSIGYHPAYFLLRAIRSQWDERPVVLAGWAMMLGYLRGAASRRRRVDERLFRFVRREQRGLLRADSLLRYWRARFAGGGTDPAD